MTDDVFNKPDEGNAEGNKDTGAQGSQSGDNPLEALVGEGKKYNDEGELVKGFNNAQEHIARLESENKSLREEAKKGANVAEVLDAIKASNSEEGDALSAEQVAKIAKETLTAETLQAQGDANQQKANLALIEMYGEKAKEAVVKRAHELGMTVDAMQEMARKSPDAVLALFKQAGDNQQQGSGDTAPSKGTINTENLNQQQLQSGKLDSYDSYNAKRKEMNKEKAGSGDKWYYTHSVQQEMIEKAAGKEDSFFG